MKKQSLALAVIFALLLSSMADTSFFSTVKAASGITGTISSDTIWTKANSPYTLTENTFINKGVSLTIEAGVTVNLNGHYLVIDGTLVARGTSTSKVIFDGGEIRLTPNSTEWNNQTSSGSIIENAILNNVTTIVGNSAMISSNAIIGEIEVNSSSPYILNNAISSGFTSITIWGGSPQIKNNHLVGGIFSNEKAKFPIISNNSIEGEVIISGGSPVISNNLITSRRGQIYLVNNNTFSLNATINVDSPTMGVGLTGYNFGEDKLYGAVVTDNTIIGCLTGICWNAGEGAIIERNLVLNCSREGLSIGSNALIENNTVANNTMGLNIYNFNNIPSIPQTPPTILNNNFENNSKYNIYSYCVSDLNATYNWWGTTAEQTIKNTIYDKTFDSALGIISSIPSLIEPNPKAYPNSIYPNTSQLVSQLSNQIFSIKSNSTISAVVFNETTSDINFTASGPSTTTGYVNATILESLMPDAESIKVYLDGNQINYSLTSSENSWKLSFGYNHSVHQVAIMFASQLPVPEFPSLVVLPLIMAATLAITVFFKKHKHKPSAVMTD